MPPGTINAANLAQSAKGRQAEFPNQRKPLRRRRVRVFCLTSWGRVMRIRTIWGSGASALCLAAVALAQEGRVAPAPSEPAAVVKAKTPETAEPSVTILGSRQA